MRWRRWRWCDPWVGGTEPLSVSRETVWAWEQGKREPGGATLRLLDIARQHPEVTLDAVAPKERDNRR